jgi:phage-related tail fiber protein
MPTIEFPSATTSATIVQPFPAGTIIPYVGMQSSLAGLAALGWLLCNGANVQISAYKALFDAIGTAFGGDGTTNFNLPDLRGQFLRGVDSGAGVDPDVNSRTAQGPNGNSGGNVGSRQPQQLLNHTHYWDRNFGQISASGSTLNIQLCDGGDKSPNQGRQATTNNDGGGNETRPVNVYVYYLIFAGLVPTTLRHR